MTIHEMQNLNRATIEYASTVIVPGMTLVELRQLLFIRVQHFQVFSDGTLIAGMNEYMNYIGNNNQVLVAVIATQHQRLFVVTVHLICVQFYTRNGTFSFLRNIERNAVVVVLHTLLTARIVHQMIENCHVDTGEILMNLNSARWRVLVHPTFLIHGYSVLNIGYRDDGVTIQVAHLPARAVFLLDIPVCDLTVLLQSVLQSVVKALFDIESDFLEIQIYMGCYAVIVMNAHDIGVVLLYQTVFHSWVIGLPYLPNDFLTFLPNFLQCFILDMRFDYIPWLSVWLLSLRSDFQLKAQKFRVMAFQIYDLRFLRADFQSQTIQKPLFRSFEQLDCI